MTYWRFDPVRLLTDIMPTGTFIRLCEVVFFFYIFYFTYKFARELKRDGWDYFKTYWSIADISIIFCSYAALGVFVYREILTNEILTVFNETKGNGYMKLQYVGKFDYFYHVLMGLILFIGNIKLIKLLRFNNRFSQLILTLRGCWDDLSGFLMVFFLVFFAFVQLFYMILQSNMDEFHSIIAALETCFTMMLNKFKFGNMKETSMTAAIMFFFFAVSCTWILINVLLTIIIGTFMEVKADLSAKGNQYEILEFLKTHGKYILGTKELPPKNNALADNETRMRSYDDSDSDNSDDENQDENVAGLPEKVDSFLVYINDMYFDGQLDITSKNALKQDLNDSEEVPRLIYNSDDVIARSPRFAARKRIIRSQ